MVTKVLKPPFSLTTDDEFGGCYISRNRLFYHGESLKFDDCNTCTCNNGSLDCQVEACPALDCQKATKREGECCPQCPGEWSASGPSTLLQQCSTSKSYNLALLASNAF